MADIDAVIDLLERWRDATGVSRLRLGIDATRVIAQLPAERKRALAVEVAERVAPQLVPAIQSESGDLSTQQVGAVVDLLRRAESDELDDLITALRTGDVGVAAGLVGEALDVVAPPDADTGALVEEAATEADDDAGEDGAAAADGDQDEGAGDRPVAATAAAAIAERDTVTVAEDGSLELDEEAVRRRLEAEAARRAQEYRDSSADIPRAPAYRAPDVDFRSSDGDIDFPDTSVESVPPLRSSLDGQDPGRPGGSGQPRLGAAPVSAVVAAITATPDGYRRRRAALAALGAGRLEAADVPPVVASFERPTDRAWVAGAALDAGLIGAAELEELPLGAPAIARLRRRAG